jgi:hypothetical protein
MTGGCPLAASLRLPGGLRSRRASIQKLGNGGDKLRWREGLFQKLLGTPFAAH